MFEMQPILFKKCDVYADYRINFWCKSYGGYVRDESGEVISCRGIASAIRMLREIMSWRKEPVEIDWHSLPMHVWQTRERNRLIFGAYKALPDFALQELSRHSWVFHEHFLHFADDGKNVAYTPDHFHGSQDRQVKISFERYLTKYYSETMKPHEIRDFASALLKGEYTVEFGETREDFLFAFSGQDLKSPSSNFRSCMSYEKDDHHYYPGLPCHPAEVYAAGDLKIAYIRNPVRKTQVVARTILYPSQNLFTKIYATTAEMHNIMQKLLEEMTMHQSVDLSGARLLKVEHGTNIVAPYVDGYSVYVAESDCGKYLILQDDEDGAVGKCDRTDGISRYEEVKPEPDFYCENCDEDQYDDESYEVITSQRRGHTQSQTWCEHCARNSSFTCEVTHDRYADNNFTEATGYIRSLGRIRRVTFCVEVSGDDFFLCEREEEYYACDDFSTVEVERCNGTETWCLEGNEDDFFHCVMNGTNYAKDDYNAITVQVNVNETEIWCREETEDLFFYCEMSNKYYEAENYTAIRVNRLFGFSEIWNADVCEGLFFLCEYSGQYYDVDFLNQPMQKAA